MKKNIKKINQLLNTAFFCNIGVFIGHSLWIFRDHRKYPDLYAVGAAPWYSSILTYGIFTLVIAAMLLILKAMMACKKLKNGGEKWL